MNQLGADKKPEQTLPPLRALAVTLESPDAAIMYAPGGDHVASMGFGEGAAEVAIRTTPETAIALQASLEAELKKHAPQRPFVDKNHEQVEATAWPESFFWSESPQPGVYLRAKLSELGRSLIVGKIMRAFSPSFHSDAALPARARQGEMVRIPAGKRGSRENPARMTRINYPDVGSLVNHPAFEKILPLWAKDAGASSAQTKPNQKRMDKDKLAALQAKKSELENTIADLQTRDPNTETAEALKGAQTDLDNIKGQIESESLKAKNAELEQALLAQRTKDAEAAVQAAVKRGAIPLKDEALQAKWRGMCISDPDHLELLAGMKGSPAIASTRLTLATPRAGIVTEDIRDVLRAYNREQDSLKRGVLYARQISPRLADLMDMPLKGADTAVGDLIVQRTLELLKFEFPVLGRVTTDFSAESARMNQEINTRIVSVPSVVAYHTTNGYVPTGTTTTDVPVTISVHNSVPIKFNANQLAGTFRDLFGEQMPAMHYAIAKDMVDALYALIIAGTFTNTPVDEAAVDFNRESVIDLGTSLTAAGVPLQGRTLLLNPTYYGRLMSDAAIVSLGANQKAEIITGNRLPMIHGFEVIEAGNLPTTGNLTGFGYSRSALCLAARVPTDVSNAFPGVSGGGASRVITNPDTGLSVLMIQHVAPVLGHAYLILAWMYGVAAGQVAAGTLLRSSAP